MLRASVATVFAAVIWAGGVAAVHAQPPLHERQYADVDIAYGATVYASKCVTCHGAQGDAIGDVNLRSELGPFGSLQQTTVGARTAGKLPLGLDYGVEMALQRGSLADDSISAWAGHYQMRESFAGAAAGKRRKTPIAAELTAIEPATWPRTRPSTASVTP